MATASVDDAAIREKLSALADGELDRAGAGAACAAWRGDAELRRTWHAWHAIGDALRSDDLACDAKSDVRFCAAVSARLAAEPVVLAPAPLASSTDEGARVPRSRWAVGSAVAAAGVVLVAGTFALMGPGAGPAPERVALVDGSAASAARAQVRPAAPAVAPGAGEANAVEVATIADQKLIRDARLDRYLVAHKQFAGSSALGVPSAFLRSATVDPASR